MKSLRSVSIIWLLAGCGVAVPEPTATEAEVAAPEHITAQSLAGGERLVIDLSGAETYRIDTQKGAIDYGRITVLVSAGQRRTLKDWLDEARSSGQGDPRLAARDGTFTLAGALAQVAQVSAEPDRHVQDVCPPSFYICGPVKCDQICSWTCQPNGSGGAICSSTCHTYCDAQCCPSPPTGGGGGYSGGGHSGGGPSPPIPMN